MRLTLLFPLACCTLALTACGKSDDGAKTPEQVQQEASAAISQADRPQPGKYRSSLKIVDVSIPGLPPQAAERMKGMFSASGQANEFCLTPEMANMGFDEFAKHAAQGNCTYDSFKAGGGTMDSVMTCQVGQGVTSHSVLHGTYSSTGSTLHMTTDSSGGGLPGGKMHMEAEVANERIGDC